MRIMFEMKLDVGKLLALLLLIAVHERLCEREIDSHSSDTSVDSLVFRARETQPPVKQSHGDDDDDDEYSDTDNYYSSRNRGDEASNNNNNNNIKYDPFIDSFSHQVAIGHNSQSRSNAPKTNKPRQTIEPQTQTVRPAVQQSKIADQQVIYTQLPQQPGANNFPGQPFVSYGPNQPFPPIQPPQLMGSERTMEQFLDRLLHESVYDRRIRPFYKDSKNSPPVNVLMNMHINTIGGISEVNMEYVVDCYFRQEWHDPRLNYQNSSWKHVEDITLHYDLVNKVWTPDAFFRNSKDAKSHLITVPNRLIRIFPEGRVLFSQRLTLRLECPMKLQKFPLDNQTCTINIGSYGYALKDIKFEWNYNSGDAVTINNKLEMPDFILTTHNATVCQRKTSTGAYACLEVHFFLKRSFGYYLVQIYIPSILTCFISFVSFWIDHKAVPARISVGLLTVLTITTQSSGIRSQLPKVSYIKAIDVWMSACLLFVFVALLEYAVVNVIARKQDLKKLVRLNEKNKNERKLRYSPKMPPVYNANNEKVLVIGNRLANLNYKKETDLLNQSHEALESLLQANHGCNSIKKTPYSNNSLHVDSAVSISGVSQQSTPPAIGSPTPIITTHTVTAGNSINAAGPVVTAPIASPAPTSTGPSPGPPRDDAQLVDFYSSFFFPISFVIFNIIYWMVYLNMQVESGV